MRVWLAVAFLGLVVRAQDTLPGRIKNFSLPEYFNPPNESRLRALLRGTEAELRADGTIIIHRLHAETFYATGERELEIRAPVCQYDSASRLAQSDGALELQTGDGRLVVRGRGFLWRRDEAILIISNDVYCILKSISSRGVVHAAALAGGLLSATGQTDLPQVADSGRGARTQTEIFADRAEFDLRSNVARYAGNVRVENPALKLRCELLTARLPAGAGRIESIVAEGNVEFDALDGSGKRIRGTGQKAVYTYSATETATNEIVELTGNPLLHSDQGTLAGDTIVFDRLTGRVTATNPRMTVLQAEQAATNAPSRAGSGTGVNQTGADELHTPPPARAADAPAPTAADPQRSADKP
ncbi:MAG: hypothetical protein NZ739_09725 [Verrucomicrobiae bacterium]|nr:hypothetical protein [Verrucomicrobiae bacterium]MCX7721842.1 hypothetical protein [Verrucomicrobiae bacterium]